MAWYTTWHLASAPYKFIEFIKRKLVSVITFQKGMLFSCSKHGIRIIGMPNFCVKKAHLWFGKGQLEEDTEN